MRRAEVVFDGRWAGDHGIGRFASQVAAGLPWQLELLHGAHPVSLRGLAQLGRLARRGRARSGARCFLSPGYCPPAAWDGPFAFTVHDLIHLDVEDEASAVKRLYYERVVRPAARRATVVFTVSQFSRDRLIDWAGLPADRVVVAGNGVDVGHFRPAATADPDPDLGTPGRPYVLHVGNHKPHKNLPRLIAALAAVSDRELGLVLTGAPSRELVEASRRHGVAERVTFAGSVPESRLPSLYRQARAVAIPSLHEGFGLPALEAMASGVPVVAADTTALPEVVGDLGILIDPTDVQSIAHGIDLAVTDEQAETAARRAPAHAATFSWAAVVQRIVDTELIG